MIPYNQLSLPDIFSDCQEICESDKPQFLSLLQKHIDLDEIVPASFWKHFYASTGRSRKYPLYGFLWALIIQKIFSIPTDSLLLVFLRYSRRLHEFCGFDKIPDVSKTTRFKQDSVHDARLLIPTLQDYFRAQPLISPKTFLGDAAFGSVMLYKRLLSGDTFGTDPSGSGIHFSKACIPLNSRAKLECQDYTLNENGVPCCPHDPSLPMKPEGASRLRSGVIRFKFSCPKVKWVKNPETGRYQRQCQCGDPCSGSPCGRMVYLYPEKNLRAYPGTLRGTPE